MLPAHPLDAARPGAHPPGAPPPDALDIPDYEAARQAALEQERVRERLRQVVGRLQGEADRRVAARRQVEERWIEDLLQYHGKYDQQTLSRLTKSSIANPAAATTGATRHGNRSQLFMNETRPKTNGFAARLFDMLFPTDDRNWDIGPTPVPMLTARAERAAEEAERMAAEADKALQASGGQDPAGHEMLAAANSFAQAARKLRSRKEEAARRAEAMRGEMDDQLIECDYGAECRDVIMDGCKLGTGVLKGPVRDLRVRRRWIEQTQAGPDGQPVTVYTAEEIPDPRPDFNRVSPWAYFPETDATCVEDSRDHFQRHLLTDQKLRGLAKSPGFDKDAIRRLLSAKATTNVPQYIQDLKSINDLDLHSTVDRYVVWEYYGTLTAEEIRDLCMCVGKLDMAADYAKPDLDPLLEVPVCIWFCQNELLKIGEYQLDSGDPLYSVFNLEKDEASIWGYGIPYICNHSQRALNSGWRMMLDNLGLCVGPQIVIDQNLIEPADGDWTLAPMKVWWAKTGSDMREGHQPFRTYNIDSHQADLSNVIEMAKRAIDEESDFPLIAQGEQGPHITQTQGGMSILMNAANVVLRRVVRNWDDDITVPALKRLYEWNMVFNPRDDIKGDFSVQAKGSSVLLVREMQTRNLMGLTQFLAHPVLGGMLKPLPLFRRLVQSMLLSGEEVVVSEEEWDALQKKLAEQAAAQADQATLDQEKIKAQIDVARIQAESRREVALIEQDTAMISLAQTHNMKLDELRTLLLMEREKLQQKDRSTAVEAAMAVRQQPVVAQGGGIL